jgi:hypothetical protein
MAGHKWDEAVGFRGGARRATRQPAVDDGRQFGALNETSPERRSALSAMQAARHRHVNHTLVVRMRPVWPVEL